MAPMMLRRITVLPEPRMGHLSTHVLDTAHGRPASGMRFALYRLDGEGRTRLAEGETGADGRAGSPLLAGGAAPAGRYELRFRVAAYFRAQGVSLPDPPFLDEVSIAFGMGADGHCHVPLLVSPFGYTTYRGS